MRRKKRNGFGICNPLKEIDWKRVDELLEAGCTGIEIAADQGKTIAALYKACEDAQGVKWNLYRLYKRESGKAKLRNAQQNRALNGSDTMLKWLGEFRLNQKQNALIGGSGPKINIVIKHFAVDNDGSQHEVHKTDSMPQLQQVSVEQTDISSYEAELYASEKEEDEAFENSRSSEPEDDDECDEDFVDAVEESDMLPKGYAS